MITKNMIDGQIVVIIENDDWKEIRKNPEYEGIPIAGPEWVDKRMEFVNAHREFAMGLRKLNGKWWDPLLLLHLNDRWQRVELDYLKCSNCDWIGWSANPFVIDLYIGLPDKEDLMKKAELLPKKKCPRCGGNFYRDRESIWVEGDQVKNG